MGSVKVDQKDFYKDLKEFRDSDIPFWAEGVKVKKQHIFVEIFRMSIAKKNSGILVFDGGGNTVAADIANTMKVYTHIGRVLEAGPDSEYDKGALVLFSVGETVGEEYSKDFLQIHQFSRTSGVEPIVPKDMSEKVDRIQNRFEEWVFMPPHAFSAYRQEWDTFIVPTFKVVAQFDIDPMLKQWDI